MTSPSPNFGLPRESASSLLIELYFNPEGANVESPDALRPQGHGSAFAYSIDDRLFLVTARHNFTGRHWQTGDALGAWSASPTHMRILWLAKPLGGASGWQITIDEAEQGRPRVGRSQIPMRPLAFPLIDDDLTPLWREHPELGGDMDVAVVELLNMPDDLLIVPWTGPIDQNANSAWPRLLPGQDVFVLGYPFKESSGPRFPLWTRGSIASHPGFGYVIKDRTYPLLLIDSRTRKGQSGSPVMRHIPDRTVLIADDGSLHRTEGPSSQLIGVYSGRTNDESDLGFVWAIEYVDVICRDGVAGTGTF